MQGVEYFELPSRDCRSGLAHDVNHSALAIAPPGDEAAIILGGRP